MDELIAKNCKEFFKFVCPDCQSKNIDLRSLKHAHKPEIIDNSDLPKKEATRLNNLPNLKESILKSEKEDLLVCCNSCKKANRIKGDILKKDLRKWLRKNYGPMIMCL